MNMELHFKTEEALDLWKDFKANNDIDSDEEGIQLLFETIRSLSDTVGNCLATVDEYNKELDEINKMLSQASGE